MARDNVPVVSVLGFVLMSAGAVLAVTAVGGKGQRPAEPSEPEPDKSRFTGRMEERFRRRFEQE